MPDIIRNHGKYFHQIAPNSRENSYLKDGCGRYSWSKLLTLLWVRNFIIIIVIDEKTSFQPRKVTVFLAEGYLLFQQFPDCSPLKSLPFAFWRIIAIFWSVFTSSERIKVVQRNSSEEECIHMNKTARKMFRFHIRSENKCSGV
jgi:hypothetical protein